MKVQLGYLRGSHILWVEVFRKDDIIYKVVITPSNGDILTLGSVEGESTETGMYMEVKDQHERGLQNGLSSEEVSK